VTKLLYSIGELAAWHPVRLALTVGFFDGVHLGHRELLRRLCAQARRLGAVSVAVTFSNSPRAFHQHEGEWRYITLPEEKLAMLAETCVDAVLMLEYTQEIAGQTGKEFFESFAAVAPVVGLCAGYDTSIGREMLRGEEAFAVLARELGAELDYVAAVGAEGAPVKSSLARRLILAGDMRQARKVLGHSYFVIGTVSAGKGRGGELLGAPTANIILPHEKISPPSGVYAGLGRVENRIFPAAIVVLTAEQAVHTVLEREDLPVELPLDPSQVVVEAHLIGFDGSIYGQRVVIDFLERLRDFRDFESRQALIEQIAIDIAMTREIAMTEGVQ